MLSVRLDGDADGGFYLIATVGIKKSGSIS